MRGSRSSSYGLRLGAQLRAPLAESCQGYSCGRITGAVTLQLCVVVHVPSVSARYFAFMMYDVSLRSSPDLFQYKSAGIPTSRAQYALKCELWESELQAGSDSDTSNYLVAPDRRKACSDRRRCRTTARATAKVPGALLPELQVGLAGK